MLKISHVAKRFGDKEVLRDVNLSVPQHSIYGFVGKNGAGKTTTMKLILGLLHADEGEIYVDGNRVLAGDNIVNKKIGYLPDVPEFYGFMNAQEYLKFCGDISGMEKRDCAERAEELLRLVGLGGETHRIKGYSRGMKQRLGVAQALMNRPKLLICDEPTSALDPVGRKEILDILTTAKEQTTVLFSTHILSDVERICDEVAFLHKGEIIMQGKVEEIKRKYSKNYMDIEFEREEDAARFYQIIVYKGVKAELKKECVIFEREGTNLKDILKIILEEGMEFCRYEKKTMSLEEVFYEYVYGIFSEGMDGVC